MGGGRLNGKKKKKKGEHKIKIKDFAQITKTQLIFTEDIQHISRDT